MTAPASKSMMPVGMSLISSLARASCATGRGCCLVVHVGGHEGAIAPGALHPQPPIAPGRAAAHRAGFIAHPVVDAVAVAGIAHQGHAAGEVLARTGGRRRSAPPGPASGGLLARPARWVCRRGTDAWASTGPGIRKAPRVSGQPCSASAAPWSPSATPAGRPSTTFSVAGPRRVSPSNQSPTTRAKRSGSGVHAL